MNAKRVVVTGGSGLTGQAVVSELVAHGYAVLSIDQRAPEKPIAPYKFADMEDIGQVYGVLAGADAVVHLAALPRPIFDTPERVFRLNTMATFNVLEAAVTLGIPRIVYASSISVLGLPFNSRPVTLQYAPIDEAHPPAPQDAYALSKYFGEELAEGFIRRAGDALTIISIRLPWIHTPETFKAQLLPFWDDPAGGASNLWSYIDTRDAALAFRLALEAHVSGHEAFFVSAANSFMNTETPPLVRQYYPSAEIRPDYEGNRSLLDTRKAEHMLGFKPVYTWEQYL